MDGCRVRPSRAAIQQKPDRLENTTRPDQLGLSEKRNGVPSFCNSRTREISSGCNSSAASPFIQVVPRRSQSPIVGSKSNAQELKLLRRSQSADRRRPSNPSSVCSRPLTPSPKSSRPSTPAYESVTEMHANRRRLLAGRTPDGVWPSMKSLSLSFGTNSSKNAVSERKWTPLSRKTSDFSENARPVEDMHGRTVDQARRLGLRSRNVSVNSSKSTSLITPSRGVLHRRIHDSPDKEYKYLPSDVQRRVTLDCSAKPKHETSKSMSSDHICSSERALPVTKCSRKSSSPIPRSLLAVPLPCSSSRGLNSHFSESNSTKNGYTVQVRKGKQSSKRIEDAHQLRVLYNRYLQWRFVNALAEDVLSAQRIRAETTLYDVESVSLELYDPFVQKRIYMQHMKQEMKLNMLLKEQITYLQDWGTIENEHFISLCGTIRALKASTLWIPAKGARVDIKAMKNAINSAVDAMQAMGSSICYFSSKVDQVSALISDLLTSARKEMFMLDDCAKLLAFAGELQEQNASLRGHIMQMGQVYYK